MVRDDPSKKDVTGWNVLIHVLEQIESQNDPDYTEAVFRQVLLEMFRRQKTLRFVYPLPPRIEVKDRILTLGDVEDTLRKSRRRKIKDIFFSTPGVKSKDESALREIILRAFSSGQNIYVFDFFTDYSLHFRNRSLIICRQRRRRVSSPP